MTTLDAPAPVATPAVSARGALRIGGLVAATALVGNLAILLVGWLAGADREVTQAGDTQVVGVATVVVASLVPVLLGTLALAVTARWGRRAWAVLAWVGLVLAVLTIVNPFLVEATLATRVTLAAMHVVSGATWFVAIRRAVQG